MITSEDFQLYNMVGEIPSRLINLCEYIRENYPFLIIYGPRGTRKTCLATEIAEILIAKKLITTYVTVTNSKSLQDELSSYSNDKLLFIDSYEPTQEIINDLCDKNAVFIIALDTDENFYSQKGYSTADTPFILTPEVLSWTQNLDNVDKERIETYLHAKIAKDANIPFRMWEDLILNYSSYKPNELVTFFCYLENTQLFEKRIKHLDDFFGEKMNSAEKILKLQANKLLFLQRPLVIHKPTGTDKRDNILSCEITLYTPCELKVGNHLIKKGFNRINIDDGKKNCDFCKKLCSVNLEKEGAHVQFCNQTGKLVKNTLCSTIFSVHK